MNAVRDSRCCERAAETEGNATSDQGRDEKTSDDHDDRLFGFQRGVMVASRSQLGRPA